MTSRCLAIPERDSDANIGLVRDERPCDGGGGGRNAERVDHDTRGQRLRALNSHECMLLLASQSIGRLVYTRAALPAVHPVNYLLEDHAILIRTSSTSKPAAARGEEIVAFQVDDLDPNTRSGWNVVITGRATEIHDLGEQQRLRTAISSWLAPHDDRVLRVHCDLITGQDFTAAPDH